MRALLHGTIRQFRVCALVALTAAAARPAAGQGERLPMPDPTSDRAAFVEWQTEARSRLNGLLGIPTTRVAIAPEARGQLEVDSVVIEKWVLTMEPGSKAPAVLYRPKEPPAGRLPAVVLTYGHGASKSHPSYQYIGQVLAKMNVICLAIDPIGEEERHKELRRGTRAHDPKPVHEAAWNASRPIMGKLVFDTMRGVDFLLTREDVDPKRIGVAGNSLGGAKAGWMAVLDTRLRCAIVSGWAFAPAVEKWGKFCTRIPNEQMRRILEWHEYLALAAPYCSILVANGDADVIIDREGKGDAWRGTDAAVAKAGGVYAALGDRKGIATRHEPGGGHRPYPAHPDVLAWLVERLNPPGWPPEKARQLPRVNFGKWAATNNVQFERLYGTPLHLTGATMAGLDVRHLPPEKLRVLKNEEVGSPEFTIEGWLEQVQRAEKTRGTAVPVGSLHELLDPHSIPRVKPWRTFQASSGLVDRFEDYGNFVREEPEGHYVLMDVQGAGCIDRFWCVYKKGRPREADIDLLVYLDGQAEPVIQMDLNDLFDGKRKPFVAPLVGRCGFEHRQSSYSYVPIGFCKSCKMVAVPRDPEHLGWRDRDGKKRSHFIFFYQLTYRICPPDVPVKPFGWEFDEEETRALAEVQTMWRAAGNPPWIAAGQTANKHHAVHAELGDARQAVLLDQAGPRTLREIRLRVKTGDDAPEARKRLAEALRIEMTWDKAEHTQVSVPAGAFFAAPDSSINVRGLWLGCVDGEYYCRLPMPFRRHAKIVVRLTNPVGAKVSVEARFEWDPAPPQPDDGFFHAERYDISNAPRRKNLLLLDARGRGHVVGVLADRNGDVESDDSWYIDGETTPSILGTGTEDFFNFAWGLGDLQALPLHGVRVPFDPPSKRGQRTDTGVCYRFHLPAAYPFQKSLRLTWEHGNGNHDMVGRYSGIVYYYLLPADDK